MIELASHVPTIIRNPHFDEGFSWGRITYREMYEETLPTYEDITKLIAEELSPQELHKEKIIVSLMGYDLLPYEKHLGLVAGFLAEYAEAVTASHVETPNKVIPLRRA